MRGAIYSPFDEKFGFAHARLSVPVSFGFLKMAKRVDVLNVRGKSAKKREECPTFCSVHVDTYAMVTYWRNSILRPGQKSNPGRRHISDRRRFSRNGRSETYLQKGMNTVWLFLDHEVQQYVSFAYFLLNCEHLEF